MQEVIVISIVAWWIAEGSNLVQELEWWMCEEINRIFKSNKTKITLTVLNCPKCLGFWLGLYYAMFIGLDMDSLPIPILTSTGAMLMSKLYYAGRSL
jgi:hypothetical protein